MRIEYEGRFLEEAVLRAAAARPEGRLFHRERARAYRVADPEERAQAFEALATAWCARFGVVRPLEAALAEQPLVADGVARCLVGRPARPRDAGADLLVRRTPRGEPLLAAAVLRVLLPPEWLFAPDALVPFLRRELQHVADTIDPRFGYAPELPPVAGPAQAELLRQRYRVAWDATVDGRLVRAGRLPAGARAERRADFLAAFGDGAEAAFARLFDDPAPTHAALAALAAASLGARGRAPRPCALCGFPGTDAEPEPGALPAPVRAEIAADFPAWTPADGCCRQCADLYRARPLSRLALAALPGEARGG
jgi:hypothetical protein